MDILNRILGKFGVGLVNVKNVSEPNSAPYVELDRVNSTLTIYNPSSSLIVDLLTGTLTFSDCLRGNYKLSVPFVIIEKAKKKMQKGGLYDAESNLSF